MNVTFQTTEGGVLKVDAAASARCAGRVAKSAQTEIMTVAARIWNAIAPSLPERPR